MSTMAAIPAGAQQKFQTAEPFVSKRSVSFRKQLSVPVRFDMKDAMARYTMNSIEPGAQYSAYALPLILYARITVPGLKSFSNGYLAGNTYLYGTRERTSVPDVLCTK